MRLPMKLLMFYLLNFFKPSTLIEVTEIRAAITYIKSIKILRSLILEVLLIGFCVFTIGVGVILLHVAVILYIPKDDHARFLLLLILGLFYILVSLVAMALRLSEKRFMAIFGGHYVMNHFFKRHPSSVP